MNKTIQNFYKSLNIQKSNNLISLLHSIILVLTARFSVNLALKFNIIIIPIYIPIAYLYYIFLNDTKVNKIFIIMGTIYWIIYYIFKNSLNIYDKPWNLSGSIILMYFSMTFPPYILKRKNKSQNIFLIFQEKKRLLFFILYVLFSSIISAFFIAISIKWANLITSSNVVELVRDISRTFFLSILIFTPFLIFLEKYILLNFYKIKSSKNKERINKIKIQLSYTLDNKKNYSELIILIFISITLQCFLVYIPLSQGKPSKFDYVIIPIIIWAVIRFNPSISIFIMSIFTLVTFISLFNGYTQNFVEETYNHLMSYEAFLLIITILNYFLISVNLEKNRVTKKLLKSLDDTIKANEAKANFFAQMSHDLRTPLNGIIGFSEILIDQIPGKINKEQKELLMDIWDSSEYLLELINSILNISKVEKEKIILNYEIFTIETLLAQCDNLIKNQIKQKKIEFSIIDNSNVEKIYADFSKLTRILINFLSNSLKFTDDHGIIKILLEREDDNLNISIIDNGIGIDENEYERIFNPFVQSNNQKIDDLSGIGLGLYTSKQFVLAHQGEIGVGKTEEGFTKFYIKIPGIIE